MSLLNPTPGEILDRLSILELKIAKFSKLGMWSKAAEFEAEKAGLEERMREWECWMIQDLVWEQSLPIVNESKNALAAINALLWAAEDEVRDAHPNELSRLARLCKHIAAMNDARNEHVRKLNKLFRLDDTSDKLYSKNVVTDIDLAT